MVITVLILMFDSVMAQAIMAELRSASFKSGEVSVMTAGIGMMLESFVK